MTSRPSLLTMLGALCGTVLVGLLVLPLLALLLSSSVSDIVAGMAHPMFAPALWLSLRTTLTSLLLTIVMGTPLAWWLATSPARLAKITTILVALPIVIPPAVVGVALLQTFGRQGLLGPLLAQAGIAIPFTESAVILSQIVVSAPFFVQAATSGFRKVEPSTVVVARTLGASPPVAFFRVALPMAMPGITAGATLAWARSLGEFGATLLFAGNMSGTTQTMPLAIFAALESDVHLAVVFSLILVAVGAILLLGLHRIPVLKELQ